jgi:ankyrin repeat protein
MTIALAVASALGTVPAPAQGPPPAPKFTKAALASADLFGAITDHDLPGITRALDAGADPNGTNWLGINPLTWASLTGQQPAVETLLAHGAKLNSSSIYGSPLTFALLNGKDDLAVYLLQRGADINPKRVDGTTSLMAAAQTNCTKALALLLKKGAALEAKNSDGSTALIFAARSNQLQTARMLIRAGAKVNTADSIRRTPLHFAAMNGNAELCALLVSRKADVTAVDANGATPLHLAARYSASGSTVKTLVAAGCDVQAKDSFGKTAAEIAARRGYREVRAELPSVGGIGEPDAVPVKQSAMGALAAIQKGMSVFEKRSPCVSCHHQGLGLMVLARAGRHKLDVDGSLIGSCMKRLEEDGKSGAGLMHAAASNPKMAKMVPAVDMKEFSIGASYLFTGMLAVGVPPNPGFAEAALVIGRQQSPNGSWRFEMPRGVMQNSSVMLTAMTLEHLNAYWPKSAAEELAQRKAKALAWLLNVKPNGSEELAAVVMGLKHAGASQSQIDSAAAKLIAAQKPDGGWGFPGADHSDAFNTGLSIVALRTAAGLPASHPAVQKATIFLVRTQDEDGTWFSRKTTGGYNNHFDAGFPHGYDQYASFAATCWATMGLMEAMDVRTASSK